MRYSLYYPTHSYHFIPDTYFTVFGIGGATLRLGLILFRKFDGVCPLFGPVPRVEERHKLVVVLLLGESDYGSFIRRVNGNELTAIAAHQWHTSLPYPNLVTVGPPAAIPIGRDLLGGRLPQKSG